MKIVVTKEDIENGKRQDPKGCPVGRALTRAGIGHCCVAGPAVILKNERQQATALLLPDAVRNWIASFDGGQAVEPIRFEVGVPVTVVCRCNGHNGSGKDIQCPAARSRMELSRSLAE